MPFSLTVQHYEKVPGQSHTRLTKVTPYVRIKRDDHPPIYVQGGGVYTESGQSVNPLPAWFDEEIARLTPKTREEIGWKDTPQPEPAPEPEPAPAAVKPVTLWTCPAEGCGQTMPTTKKGMHIARHRKAERTKET